jgi:hypothetical protein
MVFTYPRRGHLDVVDEPAQGNGALAHRLTSRKLVSRTALVGTPVKILSGLSG